jgi:hypothetical protein
VDPGVSSRLLRKTSARSRGKGNAPSAARMGMASTVTLLAASATTLDRRHPNRSTRTPPSAPPTTIGTVAKTPTIPVANGEPVTESA